MRLASLSAAVLLLASTIGFAADARPNVLMIAVDDLNHWVGYLNRNPQTKTPNIDRLAARGVRFTRSYCAAPVCQGSRTALMSGLRPSSTGIYSNDTEWQNAVAPELTIPSTFRKAGYFVAGAGKIYHGNRQTEWNDYHTDSRNDPKPTGSDGVGGIKFAPLDCNDEDLHDYATASYIIDQLGKKHDKPFFLACGFVKPHMPWNVPRKYFDMFPLDKIELPPYKEDDLADVPPAAVKMAKPEGDHKAMLDSGRWKEAVQAYLATIAYCDMNIGRVLDAYDKSPNKDNTIICFWCDHGWHLGEKQHWRKFALWEEATRSPMIWVAPGVAKPNGLCERTVDFMSIYPTLTDLCGIATPSHVEGTSIRSLLENPAAAWDKPALTTFQFKNHSVRSEKWRYTRYENGDEELYDETKDPHEWTNLASDSSLASVKAELAKSFPENNQPNGEREPQKGKKKKKEKKAKDDE